MKTGETQALLDKRAKLGHEMKDIFEQAKKQNRTLTDDEDQKWQKMNKDFDALSEQIDMHKRMDSIDHLLVDPERDGDDNDGAEHRDNGPQGGNDAFKQILQRGIPLPHIRLKDPKLRDQIEAYYSEVFFKHCRGLRLSSEESQALYSRRGTDILTVGAVEHGGYLVPQAWDKELIKTMEYYGGAVEAAKKRTTSTGNTLNVPRLKHPGGGASATAKGSIITETTADSVNDVTFENVTLGAFTYTSGLIPISWELLQDNEYDLPAEIRMLAAERIGRIANQHLTTGTGSGQPQGMVPASGLGTTAASQTLLAATELIDLEHSANSAYRKLKNVDNVGFMMNDLTLAAIKKLSYGTNDDRPLWMPSYRDSEPDRLLGYRFWINDDMANIAAGAKPIIFGNYSKYWFRQVLGTEFVVLREKYADQRMTGFFAYARLDGKLMDSNAIKHLIMAA